MKFYSEIAKFYDYIFKPNEYQENLIKNTVGLPPKKILDIACGTGTLAIRLANLGYEVDGIDLNPDMIKLAKEKSYDLNINFKTSDMLEFTGSNYDLIYCIGNSLVHLNTLNDIKNFFLYIKTKLNTKSKLLIQIINYDRILNKNINELPLIHNEEKNLTFKRFYQYDKKTNKINFTTKLIVNELIFENTVQLIPLRSHELITILSDCGYKSMELFGDFKSIPYDSETAYSLVLTASIE